MQPTALSISNAQIETDTRTIDLVQWYSEGLIGKSNLAWLINYRAMGIAKAE